MGIPIHIEASGSQLLEIIFFKKISVCHFKRPFPPKQYCSDKSITTQLCLKMFMTEHLGDVSANVLIWKKASFYIDSQNCLLENPNKQSLYRYCKLYVLYKSIVNLSWTESYAFSETNIRYIPFLCLQCTIWVPHSVGHSCQWDAYVEATQGMKAVSRPSWMTPLSNCYAGMSLSGVLWKLITYDYHVILCFACEVKAYYKDRGLYKMDSRK